MRLPSLIAALLVSTPVAAHAGEAPPETSESEGAALHAPAGLPWALDAHPAVTQRAPGVRLAPAALPHVPKPFPDDGDLDYRGDGAGGWIVMAAILGTGAATLGIVSAVSHGQLNTARDEGDAEAAERLRKRRNATGYTALGLTGGAGVCVVLNAVW